MCSLRKKHEETYAHCVRVAMLAEKLADQIELSEKEKKSLMRGCFLHDIGKIMIPTEILDHKGKLNDTQWKIMKLHPVLGSEIVGAHPGIEEEIVLTVLHHHERWDGMGYPYNLRGEEIPFFSRVCAVVDAFDSMLSDRPYKKRKTIEDAKAELKKGMASQFDASLVDIFLDMPNEVLDIY
ncbi:diguanylate cyclase [Paenibacillus sp. CAA11]|nr:diguanylate cyclase [Paenibacillus sp. CAA11]